jgi:hypothetical protein
MGMAETLSWSFTAGASSGAGLNSSGSLVAEAATSAVVTLDANMASPTTLTLQLDDVDRIAFLAIASSISDGSVEVQADGADPTPLTGPLILYGAGVKLFAGSLDTLKAQNKHTTGSAQLSMLIGRKLSP